MTVGRLFSYMIQMRTLFVEQTIDDLFTGFSFYGGYLKRYESINGRVRVSVTFLMIV